MRKFSGQIFILIFVLEYCHAAPMIAQHVCEAVTGDTNSIKVTLSILQNDDPIFKLYAFNAAGTDTDSSSNRIDACTADPTANPATDPIVKAITVDVTAASYDCGAYVYTLTASTVKVVRFLFRVYSISTTMLYSTDKVYMFECRSDDLSGLAVSTAPLDISKSPVVTLLEPKPGVYLRLLDATSKAPVSTAAIGDRVFLSVGLNPDTRQAPDNYGVHFFVGFLGNDAISDPSAPQLTVEVVPRNPVRTDIRVTSTKGEQNQVSTDGSPVVFTFTSDIMGCSDGGDVEIADKGIEIETFDQEVYVLVCNRESDTADCYRALPLSVTGTDYYAVSMETTNDASEMMIIASEDDTDIAVTLSPGTTVTVTLNATVSGTAGETIAVRLNKRQAFHLAISSSTAAESLTGFHVESTNSKPFSLISGNRKHSNDHMADQIPPTDVLGDHYVLIPVDLPGDNRLTTYIVQAIEAGDTVVTQHLSPTPVVRTLTLGATSSTTFDVQSGAPCELTSTKPISVTQVVNGPTADAGYEPVMVQMPAVSQWSPAYRLVDVSNGQVKVPLVFKSAVSATNFLVNGNSLSVTDTTPVSGPNGFLYSPGKPYADYTTTNLAFDFSTSDDVVTFMAIGYRVQTTAPNVGVGYLLAGYRYAKRGKCYKVGHKNDGLDNDCDGRIDEELEDGIDNDGDTYIDEDTGGALVVASDMVGIVGVRPINCRASALEDFSNAAMIVQMTGADGCAVTGGGSAFVPNADFTYQTGTNIGSGVQQKFHHSGVFNTAKFIDHNRIFFMCDVEYCYSSTDTKCRVACVATVRKKRQAPASSRPDNVTTSVLITPYKGATRPNTDVQSETAQGVDPGQCWSVPDFQMILGFMAALSVISTAAALFFCCLYRRRHRRRRHTQHRKTFDDSESTRSRSRKVFYVMRQ